MIADLVKFFEGGLDYKYAKSTLPVSEFIVLQKEADKINKEIENKNNQV
jgi:hypothetical protein